MFSWLLFSLCCWVWVSLVCVSSPLVCDCPIVTFGPMLDLCCCAPSPQNLTQTWSASWSGGASPGSATFELQSAEWEVAHLKGRGEQTRLTKTHRWVVMNHHCAGCAIKGQGINNPKSLNQGSYLLSGWSCGWKSQCTVCITPRQP